MNRRTADSVVGTAVALVLLVGLAATWQAWQSAQQTTAGTMMDGSTMSTSMMNTGPAPIWVFFGTVTVAGLIGVLYVVTRESVTKRAADPTHRAATDSVRPQEGTDQRPAPDRPEAPAGTEEATVSAHESKDTHDPNGAHESDDRHEPNDATESETGTNGTGRPALLDVLPEDERRILEPVVASPGLTQIELRDRADFSKSKVSQTVSDLEQRGLLSRERQGRTYRVYPAGELTDE